MGLIIAEANWTSKQFVDAATEAVINNNNESLNALLPYLAMNDLPELIFRAIVNGRQQSYDTLRNFNKFETTFTNIFQNEDRIKSLLAAAANGGNPELLRNFFNELDQFNFQNIITKGVYFEDVYFDSEVNMEMDMIQHAIRSDNPDCVRIMLSKIMSSSIKVPLHTQLSYLTDAIKKNNPSIFNVLFDHFDIKPKTLSKINIPISNFEQTDTYFLQILKEKGMEFSKYQQKIFDHKIQHKPIGIILAIGIVLQKFTDYILGKELSVEKEEMQDDNLRKLSS